MSGWIDIGAGIVFCLTGIYLFQKYAFDRNGQLWKPIVILILGVILISIGTAKRYGMM